METEYCLVQDNDGHWFVIPDENFHDWLMYLEGFTEEYDPDEPEWVIRVRGAPSNVKFTKFRIE